MISSSLLWNPAEGCKRKPDFSCLWFLNHSSVWYPIITKHNGLFCLVLWSYYTGEIIIALAKKIHTCSGERGKDLFPMTKETYGMLAMLSQLINGFRLGFGSLSHSFKIRTVEILLDRALAYNYWWWCNFGARRNVTTFQKQNKKNHLINIFEHFFLQSLFFKFHLEPENSHLTESTESTLIIW